MSFADPTFFPVLVNHIQIFLLTSDEFRQAGEISMERASLNPHFPAVVNNSQLFAYRLRHDRQLESASVKARLQSYDEIRKQNELLNNTNLNLQMTLEGVQTENQALSLALTQQVCKSLGPSCLVYHYFQL